MGATKVNNKKKHGEVNQPPLKGTWISVGVVGAVIVLTYLILYGLFMARL